MICVVAFSFYLPRGRVFNEIMHADELISMRETIAEFLNKFRKCKTLPSIGLKVKPWNTSDDQ